MIDQSITSSCFSLNTLSLPLTLSLSSLHMFMICKSVKSMLYPFLLFERKVFSHQYQNDHVPYTNTYMIRLTL